MITYYKKFIFTFFYLGFILSAYSIDAQFSMFDGIGYGTEAEEKNK